MAMHVRRGCPALERACTVGIEAVTCNACDSPPLIGKHARFGSASVWQRSLTLGLVSSVARASDMSYEHGQSTD